MKQMLKFLEHHKKESILAPLFKMLEALFDLLVPLIVADMINQGIAGQDTAYIIKRSLLMIGLGVVGLACSITAQYFSAKASVEACAGIRHSLFDKIQSLSFSQLDTSGTGTLITRMTSDVNQLQNGLNLFLRLFMRSPFVVFGAMILSFTISLRVAPVFAVTIPVLSIIIFYIMLKTIPLYQNVQSRLDGITGITRENLRGVRVVRAFGREEDETERFERADEELAKSQMHVGRISAMMNPLCYAVVNLAIVAVLYSGGLEVDSGALSVGAIVALVNYMNQILLELVKLANLIIQLTKAAACSERINAVLAWQPDMAFGQLAAGAEAQDKAIEFDHVSLSYENAGKESLSDISFAVRRGETVGIVGGTGSGKTSLISLLPRYYDATQGRVKILGHDAQEYSKESLRGRVSTVMQRPQLFSGTIRSNLLWGNQDATDEELWRALELAQAAEFVRRKPLGLDEAVEQGGRNYSGGQKQRLSIARSLVGRPDILILDDSSSALDYATDAALRHALASLPEDMTLIIVSQRAGSIVHADQILVLDDGKLAGIGRHEQLLHSCAVYRDIYESQLAADEVSA